MKLSIPKVQTESQSDTSVVDADWLPDNERQLQKVFYLYCTIVLSQVVYFDHRVQISGMKIMHL